MWNSSRDWESIQLTLLLLIAPVGLAVSAMLYAWLFTGEKPVVRRGSNGKS